jgi:hypothetical protein
VVAQLNIKLREDRLEALRRYAARRRTPMAWLLKDYVEYLLAGGEPVNAPPIDVPTPKELAEIAQYGESFDWLEDEPEIYSLDDAAPI